MCYFVCSDIAHFGNKGKQKSQYHEEKQEKFVFFMLKKVQVSLACLCFEMEED